MAMTDDYLLNTQARFNRLLTQRAAVFHQKVDTLPDLKSFLHRGLLDETFTLGKGASGRCKFYFENDALIVESWFTDVSGSGQKHRVTDQTTKLLEQGFV